MTWIICFWLPRSLALGHVFVVMDVTASSRVDQCSRLFRKGSGNILGEASGRRDGDGSGKSIVKKASAGGSSLERINFL